METYWIVSRYFVRCSHCGYEIFISGRHTVPRVCPGCCYEIIDVKEEK